MTDIPMTPDHDPSRRAELLFLLLHGGARTESIANRAVDLAVAEAQVGGSVDQQRGARRAELLEASLIDYINRADTPAMVSHVLTGLMALANVRANDEFPTP